MAPDTPERHFTFLLAGGRPGGNTETLSRRAAAGLPSGAAQVWLDLRELTLPGFHDRRHGFEGDAEYLLTDHERVLLDATLACSDLVIVSPVYWGSLAAPGKLYLDHVVNWVRLPGIELRTRMRGKTLWGVAVLNGPGHDDAKPMADLLESAAGYLDMRFGGLLLGNGDRPGDVLGDTTALEHAERFFGARGESARQDAGVAMAEAASDRATTCRRSSTTPSTSPAVAAAPKGVIVPVSSSPSL